MVNLKELLSSESIENLTASQAVEGAVFRMHLGEDEGVKGKNPGDEGRNKYFVVLGHDSEGNAIGFVLVDTVVNPDALTFFKGKISSSDYANRYGVSTKTAKRDLSDMSDKKLIDIEGDRKTSRYIFAQ